MKPRFKGHRFLTQGIIGTLDPVVQYAIWRYLDQFSEEHSWLVDYLQIFHLKTIERGDGRYLVISHEQEVPELVCEEALVFPTDEEINEKIYVISDRDETGEEYATMLLANEY